MPVAVQYLPDQVPRSTECSRHYHDEYDDCGGQSATTQQNVATCVVLCNMIGKYVKSASGRIGERVPFGRLILTTGHDMNIHNRIAWNEIVGINPPPRRFRVQIVPGSQIHTR